MSSAGCGTFLTPTKVEGVLNSLPEMGFGDVSMQKVRKEQASEMTVQYSSSEEQKEKGFYKHAVIACLSWSLFESNKTPLWNDDLGEKRRGNILEKGRVDITA